MTNGKFEEFDPERRIPADTIFDDMLCLPDLALQGGTFLREVDARRKASRPDATCRDGSKKRKAGDALCAVDPW